MQKTWKHKLLYVACCSALSGISNVYAQTDTAVEVIEVRGIRGSLEKALDRKREAPNAVDSITAEDMGKFPDQNIAESLQRVSGVFIDRKSGEGSKITVRGFGPEFNSVRLNDRTIATISNDGEVDYSFSKVGISRAFDFQALAAEVLTGADVVKTPTSDLWDGSIGASINMRTARPLDKPGLHMSGSVQGRYQDMADNWDPRLSGLISNTSADETMGFLFAASYEDRSTQLEESRGGQWAYYNGVTEDSAETIEFRFPQEMGQSFTIDDRKRLSTSATFQYQPNDNMGMTVDALYVDFKRETTTQGINAPLQFPNFSKVEVNENGTATSFVKSFGPVDYRFEERGGDSETIALGWNGFYHLDNGLELTADVSWSRAEAWNQGTRLQPAVKDNNPWNDPLAPGTLDDPTAGETSPEFKNNIITWANGDVPSWSTSFDLSDPANARAHVALTPAIEREDEVFEARFDGSFLVENSVVSAVKAGVFYSDRKKDALPYNSGTYAPTNPDGPFDPGYSSAGALFGDHNFVAWFDPTDGVQSPWEAINVANGPRPHMAGRFFALPEEIFTPVSMGSLLSDSGADFPREYLLTDLAGYCSAIRKNSGNNNVCTTQARPDLARNVEETNYGAYVKVDLMGEFQSMFWSANFGLRYVETETTASGPSVELIRIESEDPNGATSGLTYVTTPRQQLSAENSYSNFLPSANFKLELSDSVDFRAAASKVITRPNMGAITPSQNFSGLFGLSTRTANNPYLEPFEAWQYDTSLEYYADNGNAFSISLFYKDVTTSISETTELLDSGFNHPAFGDIILQDTAQRNVDGGSVQGYELAGLVYFDFLPGLWSNTGIQANYTFVAGNDEGVNADSQPLVTAPGNGLEGFTPHSYNVIAFYEDDSFSARVSWNWRDSFLVKRSGLAGIPEHFDEYGQLDLGFGYSISENTKLTFDISNLLDENAIRYADVRERVIHNEYTGRRALLGVRMTF
ncbi:TonB-dependent receptor [Thalassotalea agariperforans]